MSIKNVKKCWLNLLKSVDQNPLIENQEAYGENYRSPNRVGKCSAVVKDPETGIYIVPITALKP